MTTRRRVLGSLFASFAVAAASLATQTTGIAGAAPPPAAQIVSLTLGRPVLPAAGGASAVRLTVRNGVTCWVTAPAAVSVERAHHGCRIGRFAVPARVRASDTTATRRFVVTAWVKGADGRTVRRAVELRQRGVAPLRVTTTSVPPMTVGSAYAARLAATGGSGAYTWSVAAGSLPPGIGLSSSGLLAGTPASAGTYPVTVAVDDRSVPRALRATAGLTIVVAPPALSLVTPTLPAATVGATYTATLGATGGTGPYTWAVTAGSLPPGIGLSAGGTLSGVPTTAGTYTATVRATDSSASPQTAYETLTIVVSLAPLSLTSVTLPGASVGVTYSATLGATGGTTPYTWAVTAGSLPPGIALSTYGTLTGTPTTVGTYSATVRVVDSSPTPQVAYETVTITVSSTLAVSTAGALPGAVQSAPYATTLAATGGVLPYTWSLYSGSLPAGLTLAAGGLISGTPTATGTATFTVKVTDATLRTVTATMTLKVTSPLAFVASTLPSGTVGTTYPTTTLQATGGTPSYTWSLLPGFGSLPPGLGLSSSGTISGTPNTAGTYTFVVKVTDASSPAQSVQVSFTVTVS